MIRYDVSTLPSLWALTLIALAVGDARSAVATFDGFAEGPIASPFVDGGITFSMPKTSSGGGNVFTASAPTPRSPARSSPRTTHWPWGASPPAPARVSRPSARSA